MSGQYFVKLDLDEVGHSIIEYDDYESLGHWFRGFLVGAHGFPPRPDAPGPYQTGHTFGMASLRDLGPFRSKRSAAKGENLESGTFVPPTHEEAKAYCDERGNSVDLNRWFGYYEAKGWRVGRNKMKDWRGAIRTWEPDGFIAIKDRPKPKIDPRVANVDKIMARFSDEQILAQLKLMRNPPTHAALRSHLIDHYPHAQRIIDELMGGKIE